MAKTVTRKPAGRRRASSTKAAPPSPKPQRSAQTRSKPAKRAGAAGRVDNDMNAADALIGLLESPLVADVLAAGAAAALAAFTASRVSRRREGGSKQALKNAAKAAAAAMGERLSEEFDEIMKSAKAARSEAR